MIFRGRLLLLLIFSLACGAAAQSDPQNTPANPDRDSVTAPKLTSDPAPEYSDEARKARHQGTVVLSLVVDATGLPQDIKVQRSLGMGLDEEAVKAVKQWRFEPATQNGQPVPVMINVEVNFRLYNHLAPHPDSASQPPRFPGVDLEHYPLVLRVNSAVSYSGPATAQSANYEAAITEAGKERTVKISCLVSSPRCLILDAGTYPAGWKADTTTLEILGLTSQKEWEKTEYTIAGENH